MDRVLGTAEALQDATTWTERFLALAPYFNPDLRSASPVHETRAIPDLVEAMYARLGATLTDAQRAALEAQAAALPPSLGVALRDVLGAIDLGLADWERAVAGLTEDDWRSLGEHDALTLWEDLEAAARLAPIHAKIDARLIQASAARLLATLDAATPLLEEAAVESVAWERAPLFPGPNEGVLFNDPFNLILVGDVVRSVYRGNTWPFPNIRPLEHLLIIDLGGDDEYLNHPARADSNALATIGIFGSSPPVSVVVDVSGADLYFPPTDDVSTAFAAHGGVAVLLDVAGNDEYVNRIGSSQGSVVGEGVALLLDGIGDDLYVSNGYSQAATQAVSSVSIVMDLQGDDRYAAQGASQGVNVGEGSAFSIDLQGDDFVTAGDRTQGRALFGGVAMHLNVGGSDYYGSGPKTRGFAESCWDSPLPLIPTCPMDVDDFLAVFLDTCGIDTYVGDPGRDDQLWQQNMFGIGLDIREAGSCTANE